MTVLKTSRGKTITGEWVFGLYAEVDDTVCLLRNAHITEVRPDTVGYYAQCMDRDDNAIFIGDIINVYPWGDSLIRRTVKAVVLWSSQLESPAFFIGLRRDENGNRMNPLDEQSYEQVGFLQPEYTTVVGNVFDHPYLLQEV